MRQLRIVAELCSLNGARGGSEMSLTLGQDLSKQCKMLDVGIFQEKSKTFYRTKVCCEKYYYD